jgi:hypothetical protein
MISLEEVGREKRQIDRILPGTPEPIYNHATQRRWADEDLDSRKMYMKSSTQFDGETDNGGDDK